jgi:hypothetical protein
MSLGGQLMNSGLSAAKYAADVDMRRETIADGLKRQLTANLESQRKIERLLMLLEKNPDFMELLNLVREVGM